MEELKIRQLTIGMMATNCYIISNCRTKEAILVDPADQADRILSVIEENQLKPVAILLTHGHFDHMGAADELRKQYSIKVFCHKDEIEVMANSRWNLSELFAYPFTLKADETFQDKETLSYLGRKIQVLFTPGHTKGSCCFYFPEDGILLSGDTLFAESVGRTDFPTGSTAVLIHSIEEILLKLPNETIVYPGHNDTTTIEHEKKYNPCVRGK